MTPKGPRKDEAAEKTLSYLAQLFSFVMRQKRPQALESSVDALHPTALVGVGDLATDATLLIDRAAAAVAAEKFDSLSLVWFRQALKYSSPALERSYVFVFADLLGSKKSGNDRDPTYPLFSSSSMLTSSSSAPM